MPSQRFFLALFCLSMTLTFTPTSPAHGHSEPKTAWTDDELAVQRAVLDYVEGVYEANPDRILRSVHPDLAKFGFGRTKDGTYQRYPMTRQGLVDLATSWNAKGDQVPADAPKDVELFEVLDKIATAKATAVWGIDYFHLVKYEDGWKIVQVIWQSAPEP